MITSTTIREELQEELLNAETEIESKMIIAEYKNRMRKLEEEGEESYILAYILPYDEAIDCGCGK